MQNIHKTLKYLNQNKTGKLLFSLPTPQCHSLLSVDTDNNPSTSDTLHVNPMTDMAKKLNNFLTSRPIISQVFNFLRGFQMHRNYCDNCDFTAWKGQNIIYVVKFNLTIRISSIKLGMD